MRFLKTTLISAFLVMTLSISALANSAPITIDSSPGFSIAPSSSTAIAVESEYLEFDTSKDYGLNAKVKAVYEMKNTSADAVEQPMLFPFINAGYEDFTRSVRITKDGIPVDFNYFRLDDIPEVNKGIIYNLSDGSNSELSSFFKIDNIINRINSGEYQPTNYSLNQIVTVYNVHLPVTEKSNEVTIKYKINTKDHKILFTNINGYTWNANGSGTFTIFTPNKNAEFSQKKARFVVLGEDAQSKAEFKSETGENITTEQMSIEDFIENYISQSSSYDLKSLDTTGLKSYTIERLDTMLAKSENLLSLDYDVIEPFLNTSYLGAFLYTVSFEPESSATVTVEYEVRAARSREKTKDYTNAFLYLLQPAAAWKDFGSLTVKVLLHEANPFIIESSLPLTKDDNNNYYAGQFDGLPDKDFYFVTYYTDKPDPPIVTTMGIKWETRNTLLPLLGLLIIILLTIFFISRNRKMN